MITNMIQLDDLKEPDVYSLSLFLLYKLSDIPKMTVISELPYILDETNMLKLCKYMGGKTIRVPTITELSDSMRVLLLYQFHKLEGRPFAEALVAAGFSTSESYKATLRLKRFEDVLKEYKLELRDSYAE